MTCFGTFFYQYFMYKKCLWTASDIFPPEYEQSVQHVLESFAPNVRRCDTLEEASQAVAELSKKLIEKALSKVGLFYFLINNNG